jgi:anti-anti-sigma factor
MGPAAPFVRRRNELDIDVRKHGNVQVIKLRGDLKLGEPVDSFRQTVADLMDGGDVQVLVNLAEVRMIDSSGIGALMRCLASLKQRGGTIKLLNPSKLALQTFKIVGVLNLLEIYDDDQLALASFA